jgi:broad specificity phosphatase PhoE
LPPGTTSKLPISPELREIDFGSMEGLDINEIHQQFPDIYGLIWHLSIIEAYPEINIRCLLNDVSHLMAEGNS